MDQELFDREIASQAENVDANVPSSARRLPLAFRPPPPARPRYRAFGPRQLHRIAPLAALSTETRFAMEVVAAVLPFRVNAYVIDELIDWTRVPDDPIFQLTFPQRGMLEDDQFQRVAGALRRKAPAAELDAIVGAIRADLNPHPAGQQSHNVPELEGERLAGLQHKYPETVLFFPSQGQTCHAYCTFCFRWAQFIGDQDLKFADPETGRLVRYLATHPEVSDVLITGGDPMVMKTKHLAAYLEPLLEPEFDHIQSIRIGSKALTFWPHRFVSDPDADDLLRLLEKIVQAGKHVAFMAHLNHPRELSTPVAERAVRRIRATGAVIRAQAPLLAHINDDPSVWAELWRREVDLGIVPYYMFVERDTGARRYFEVPLVEAHRIHREARRRVSGLARTARGPSMSAGPGKVEIQGLATIAGEEVMVLRFIQARELDWVQRPFFAARDDAAPWLAPLRPAFGEPSFFFEPLYRERYGARSLR